MRTGAGESPKGAKEGADATSSITSPTPSNPLPGQPVQIEGKSYTFTVAGVGHEKVETKGKPDQFFVYGYISTEDIDAVHDLVTRAALEDMLKQVKGRNIPVKIDVEHETVDKETGEIRNFIPVGKIVDGRLDNKGLWVKVKLNDAIERFGEIWGSIKNGNLDAFSITFKVKDFTERMISGVKTRVIHQLELINVALTGTPINPAATITETFAKAVRDLEAGGDGTMEGKDKHRDDDENNENNEGKDKHIHSEKWERCVRRVKKEGGVRSPEAVCTAVLGAESFKAAHLRKDVHKVRQLMEAKGMGDENEDNKAAAEAEAKAKADAENKAAEDKAAAENKAGNDTESKALTELKAKFDVLTEKHEAVETELKALRELPILKAVAAAEPAAPGVQGTGAEQKSASPMNII